VIEREQAQPVTRREILALVDARVNVLLTPLLDRLTVIIDELRARGIPSEKGEKR